MSWIEIGSHNAIMAFSSFLKFHRVVVAVDRPLAGVPAFNGIELGFCKAFQYLAHLPDMLGPFYEPGAPVRTSVGSGYVLSGAVLAAEECKPIRKARIEFWLANSRGDYDDAHRATVFASERGEYRFQSNVPVSYGGRPPHIHVRVTVPGYGELVTQHYPEPGQRKANIDLVLVEE